MHCIEECFALLPLEVAEANAVLHSSVSNKFQFRIHKYRLSIPEDSMSTSFSLAT